MSIVDPWRHRMCLEEEIHARSRLEGLPVGYVSGEQLFNTEPTHFQPRSNTMPKRYKRLILILLVIAGGYVARETGLDQGLIDEAIGATSDAIFDEGAEE